jgi:hypothetical protein
VQGRESSSGHTTSSKTPADSSAISQEQLSLLILMASEIFSLQSFLFRRPITNSVKSVLGALPPCNWDSTGLLVLSESGLALIHYR